MRVKAVFNESGAKMKGRPDLAGVEVEVELEDHPRVADAVYYKGKRVCGWATFNSSDPDEEPVIRLL